jgi:hypothetical protein
VESKNFQPNFFIFASKIHLNPYRVKGSLRKVLNARLRHIRRISPLDKNLQSLPQKDFHNWSILMLETHTLNIKRPTKMHLLKIKRRMGVCVRVELVFTEYITIQKRIYCT